MGFDEALHANMKCFIARELRVVAGELSNGAPTLAGLSSILIVTVWITWDSSQSQF